MPDLPTLLAVSSQLTPARSQMAFTLGFHIILASIGVAFPALMLIANYRGLRHKDPVALELAQRWSKVAAVLFAVGAVTGTVLSFEFGLLWPEFTDRFGEVFGVAFAIEGIFFFTEAIFIAIYIYGWNRLSGWAHFWTGVPVVISGLGGAFSVVAVNSWMNQPDGFKIAANGQVTDVAPLDAIFNRAAAYEVPHMILAAYLVTGFLVASVYAVGMLRGRRDRHHRLGLLIPLTVAAIVDADPVRRRRHRGPRDRRRPADQVRRHGVRPAHPPGRHRVPRRPLHRRTASRGGSGSPASTRSWSASAPTPRSSGWTPCLQRSPAGEHNAALGLRRDGGHLHPADRARGSGLVGPGGEGGTSRARRGSCARWRSRGSPRSSRSSAAGS